ncbi:MAG: type II toxin-antitoxin system RelE/ParE family toxin [Gammaproteobacteria bacterium]|nr:type II toxin-antitoxin system RelE/ParE family toxin [Gammaproteobacteria bacterium]
MCLGETLFVRHQGLQELLERNSSWLLKQGLASRIRNVLTALVLAESLEDLRTQALPGWRIHKLSGDREDDWSILVSGNWRITFEENDGTIERLNLEDYH